MTQSSIIEVTFEDVTSKESWEIACECKWHKDGDPTPAEWIVRTGPRPCGCKARIVFMCDPCLVRVVASAGMNVRCRSCNNMYRLGDEGFTWEPIHGPVAA